MKDIKHIMMTYPAATMKKIETVEETLQVKIPDIYVKFLLETNGAVCNLASLYGTDALIEMNQTYEVQEYANGYISIGNDGGGYHLLMEANKAATEFRLVSDGVGTPSTHNTIDIFEAWLHSNEGNPWRNNEN